ncbi:hypothetical protein GCM10023205_43090 [Yinghuangia aomiensis]|uniref:Uncharacterized protein n=1 Tax=Yinghuangia aomiensis TaxID=676205 RepID=A0ABP9HK02_9ACTN
MIFLFLRRMGHRARLVTGLVCVAAGLVLVAASAVVAALLPHGVALAVIGAGITAFALRGERRGRTAAVEASRAAEPAAAPEPPLVGRSRLESGGRGPCPSPPSPHTRTRTRTQATAPAAPS